MENHISFCDEASIPKNNTCNKQRTNQRLANWLRHCVPPISVARGRSDGCSSGSFWRARAVATEVSLCLEAARASTLVAYSTAWPCALAQLRAAVRLLRSDEVRSRAVVAAWGACMNSPSTTSVASQAQEGEKECDRFDECRRWRSGDPRRDQWLCLFSS